MKAFPARHGDRHERRNTMVGANLAGLSLLEGP